MQSYSYTHRLTIQSKISQILQITHVVLSILCPLPSHAFFPNFPCLFFLNFPCCVSFFFNFPCWGTPLLAMGVPPSHFLFLSLLEAGLHYKQAFPTTEH